MRLFSRTIPGIRRGRILEGGILSASIPAMGMGFVILAIGFIRVSRETGFSWLALEFGRVGLRRRGVWEIWLGRLILAISLGFWLIGLIGSVGGSFKVFEVGIILNNLPKVRMFLRLNILLNQLVEKGIIAMFNNADDLIRGNLMIAGRKKLREIRIDFFKAACKSIDRHVVRFTNVFHFLMNTFSLKRSESSTAFPFSNNITKSNNSRIIISKHFGFSRLEVFKSLTRQQQFKIEKEFLRVIGEPHTR
jgi:hypothetical protein